MAPQLTLKAGSYVISAINMVLSILAVLHSISAMHNLINHDEVTEYYGFFLACTIIGFLTSVGYLIVSVTLVQGCKTRNRQLVMPFVFWNYISLGFWIIGGTILFLVLIIQAWFMAAFILGGIMSTTIAITGLSVRIVQKFANNFEN